MSSASLFDFCVSIFRLVLFFFFLLVCLFRLFAVEAGIVVRAATLNATASVLVEYVTNQRPNWPDDKTHPDTFDRRTLSVALFLRSDIT